jgi:hypothetical protein
MMMDGANKMDPATKNTITAVTSGPLKPNANAITKHAIATAHNR